MKQSLTILFFIQNLLLFAEGPVESRANYYIVKSMQLEFSDPELSQKFCDSAFLFSIKGSDDHARSLAMQAMLNEDGGIYTAAISEYKSAFNIYIKNKNYKDAASSLNGIGTCMKHTGRLEESKKYYLKTLKLCKKYDLKREESIAYDNLGILCAIQGDEKKGLYYYLKGLKINQEIQDTIGLISSYNYIARSFEVMNDLDSSEKYVRKSLRLTELAGDSILMTDAMSNLAILIKGKGRIREAIKLYKKVIGIRERWNDITFLPDIYANLALSYLDLEIYDSVFLYQSKALKLSEELGNTEQVAHLCISIGEYHIRRNDWKNAILFLQRGYKLSQEINLLSDLHNAAKRLSISYASIGDYRNAYEFHVKYKDFSDSLFNADRTKEMTRMSMQFNFDKTQRAQEIEQAKKDERKKAELEQQEMMRNIFILVSGLLVIIAGIIFYNFREGKKKNIIISKQKKEVEEQKDIVEEKNKEILDSIAYAKRLQDAILPPMKVVKEYLEDSFILYKPKDIVAGDFYFTEGINDLVVFAAADCTGHGVPGAMVSVVCSNALNRAVKEFKITDAGKILDKVRELVLETFSRSESEVKDGMDISLCVLDVKNRILHWSGANNPLWLYRLNNLTEFKPDKQPIGKYVDAKSFKNHEIILEENDTIYIFTDGFEDQFGGEKGKKFKASKMKELFLSLQDNSMSEQKELINNTFEKWRGSLEQVDDVCIIGVRIK